MEFFASKKSGRAACILLVLFVVLLVVFFAGFAPHAYAQTPTPSPASNPAVSGAGFWEYLTGKVLDLPLSIWYILFLLYSSILSTLLFITAFILDNVFIYNIILNPNNMPAVVSGWTVTRDVVNSLFILLLIWIALQTIFDLGQSKKFLVRIILFAFLMNFSLVFVSATFGFANALAKPFRDLIPIDVAGFIVQNTRLSTITATPDQSQITAQQQALQKDPTNCGLASLLSAEWRASDALKQDGSVIGCALGSSVSSLMQVSTSFIGKSLSTSYFYPLTVELAIADFFLVLVIVTLIGEIIFLTGRIVAMVFLAVTAPFAFFLHITPYGKAEGLSQRWFSALFCWAFAAPAFYFLFYISLYLLSQMSSAPVLTASTTPFADNVLAMLPLTVFLVFLWATMWISKGMGCEGSKVIMDIGKKVVGAVVSAVAAAVTGGAAAAAGVAMRAAGPVLQGAAGKIAQTPVARTLLKPVTSRVRNYYAEQNEKVNDHKKERSTWSPKDLADDFRAVGSAQRKLAEMELLAEKGHLSSPEKMASIGITEHDVERSLNWSRQYGRENILKSRLDLATKDTVADAADDTDAKKKVIAKIRPEQMKNLAAKVFDDRPTMSVILQSASPEQLKHLGRDTDAYTNLQKLMAHYMGQMTSIEAGMREDTKQFLRTSPILIAAAGAAGSRAASAATSPLTGVGPSPGTPPSSTPTGVPPAQPPTGTPRPSTP